MRHQAKPSIESARSRVALPDLNLDRLAIPSPALLEEFTQQLPSDALPPEFRLNEQVINVAAEGPMLHGVPNREYRVSNGDAMPVCQPGATQLRSGQQGKERRPGPRQIQLKACLRVEGLHQADKGIHHVGCRTAYDDSSMLCGVVLVHERPRKVCTT